MTNDEPHSDGGTPVETETIRQGQPTSRLGRL
ncbi:MAG: hypothetical protein J07HB67_02686, partial [halophilic archaeon J07HB67]